MKCLILEFPCLGGHVGDGKESGVCLVDSSEKDWWLFIKSLPSAGLAFNLGAVDAGMQHPDPLQDRGTGSPATGALLLMAHTWLKGTVLPKIILPPWGVACIPGLEGEWRYRDQSSFNSGQLCRASPLPAFHGVDRDPLLLPCN